MSKPTPAAPRRPLRSRIGDLAVVLLMAAAVAGLMWSYGGRTPSVQTTAAPSPIDVDSLQEVAVTTKVGPPWYLGPASARFTIVVYGDLECPFCKDHLPQLQRWAAQHADLRLQWHHRPLAIHEPKASEAARLVECAGRFGGEARFWEMLGWYYRNTRSDGQGLPEGLQPPRLDDAMRACLQQPDRAAIVQTQADVAAQDGVVATPTVKVIDQQSGRSLLLPGAVMGDALLSALDLLAAPLASQDPQDPQMPADTVGDMPR